MSRHRLRVLGWCCGVLLARTHSLPAQETKLDGAYLNTHFEAQELLSRAALLAEGGQWSSAVRVYEDVVARFGANLFAGPGGHYGCIRDEVIARISRWPREGLAEYRASLEKPARAALESALVRTYEEALAQTANRYFPTRAGLEAMERFLQRAFERGDFQTARRGYERLAAMHPDRDERASTIHDHEPDISLLLVWRARAAFCAAAMGETSPLDALIEELETSQSPARVAWGGRDQRLLDWLIQSRAEAAFLAQTEAGTDCPFGAFAAGPARDGRYPSIAEADARLWKFWDGGRAPVESELSSYESGVARKDAWLRMVQSGRLLAAYPASDCTQDGRPWLFVHDGRSVWSVDPLRTDRPVWRYEAPGAPTISPTWTSEDEPPPQYTCLVYDGRVFAPLERERPPTSTGQTLVSTALVCLDAATGALLWESDLSGLASAFEEARLDGAPLLHDGKLYSVLRRRKPFGFETCLLLRLDPASGKVLWSTHLGESATGSYGYRRPTLTHAAASGDLVFVQTNLGAVAAVHALDGHVIWLQTYASRFDESSDGFWPSRLGRPIRSWQYSAPIAWRDAVVVMPLDAERLFVLGQFDGRVRYSVDLEKLGNPEQFVGVRQDLLYLAGSQITAFNLTTRGIVWQRAIDNGQLFGRAALTTDSLWVPTTSALIRYRLRGGPVETMPWISEEAGNVLPLADQLVVACAKGLYGLSGKSEAFAKIEQRLRASGNDPDVALALAELAFNTGETKRGLEATRLAVEKMGGFARITSESDRRRLFNVLTQFAHTILPRPDEDAGARVARAEAAVTLHRMAGQCAPDAASQIAFRLGLGRAYSLAGQPRQAVTVYQQILCDDALRISRVEWQPEWHPVNDPEIANGETEGERTAGRVVETWIDRLIAAHGRDVYEPIESQAQGRLKLASSDSDPASLLKISEAYPNSLAAGRARVIHAERMESRQDWPAALRSYRAALWNADNSQRPDMLRRYVTCLARAGRRELAAQWLARAVRDYPDHRFDLEGRLSGFGDLRVRLLGEVADAIPPAKNCSLTESWRRVYPDRVNVLEPTQPGDPSRGDDIVLTFSGNQLEARHVVTGRAVWPTPLACSSLPQFLTTVNGCAVFASAHQIFAVRLTSGQQSWAIGAEPEADPMAEPEDTPGWSTVVVAGPRIVAVSEDAELVCIEAAEGTVRWRRRLESSVNHQLTADGTRVCYATWQGRKHTLQILDALTGETVHSNRQEDDWPIQRLAMTPESDIVLLFSGSLQLISSSTGQTRWRATGRDRFVAASMHVDEEGVVISPDGKRLCRYDIDTGRVLWTGEPVTAGAADGLWTQTSEGVVYAACGGRLAAYDLGDGRQLWQRTLPTTLRAETPRLTRDAIYLVFAEKASADAKTEKATRETSQRYRVVRHARLDGREVRVSPSGPLLTEPLTMFGGLHVFNDALLVVDGSRLIGYTGAKATTSP